MSSMMEVQGIATDRHDTFPYSAMRILGCIQITIGVLVFVLGVVDIILTMTSYNDDVVKYGGDYDTIVSMTIASAPLWCGLWFSITGALGTCISRDRAHTLQFFKIGFLVLNVMCCALFGPVCTVMSGMIAYTRHRLESYDLQWLLSLVICFLGILEIVIATVAASVTCCCSPLRATQVHVYVNPRDLKAPTAGNELVVDHDSSGVSTRGLGSGRTNNISNVTATNPRTTPFRGGRHQQHPTNSHDHDNSNNMRHREEDNPREIDLPGTPDHSRRPRVEAEPRAVISEAPPNDGFGGGSSSYSQIKKWALPHW